MILAREWDAGEYEKLSAPQTRWGVEVLERMDARGDEAAIDAGCGTGRVTELLLAKLPQGSVLAIDGSRAMVEAARRRFAGEPRVRVECQDLLSLEVEERVDLIFSTATFHWIWDHDRLFENLARAIKPGGRLVAQCGGEGNISRATRATKETMEEERFLDYFVGWEDDKYYADAEDARRGVWRPQASRRSRPGCTMRSRRSIRWTSSPASSVRSCLADTWRSCLRRSGAPSLQRWRRRWLRWTASLPWITSV